MRDGDHGSGPNPAPWLSSVACGRSRHPTGDGRPHHTEEVGP